MVSLSNHPAILVVPAERRNLAASLRVNPVIPAKAGIQWASSP